MLKISEKAKDGVVILELKGKLMGGPDANSFRDTVVRLCDEGKKKLLVDMSGVSWIDSTGLGVLISTYTTVCKAGGALKLLRLTKRIHNLFVITQLITVLEDFDDEDKALASFG
jgi:anti-sigma B factor antagonist